MNSKLLISDVGYISHLFLYFCFAYSSWSVPLAIPRPRAAARTIWLEWSCFSLCGLECLDASRNSLPHVTRACCVPAVLLSSVGPSGLSAAPPPEQHVTEQNLKEHLARTATECHVGRLSELPPGCAAWQARVTYASPRSSPS